VAALGPGALRLGLAALSRMDSFREAAIALTDYVAETGATRVARSISSPDANSGGS
jgi:DNA-binding IclR family transcriptional regulator